MIRRRSRLLALHLNEGDGKRDDGRIVDAVTPQATLDLLAEELRVAQNALSEITGEFSSDDLLGVIFSSFCIGK